MSFLGVCRRRLEATARRTGAGPRDSSEERDVLVSGSEGLVGKPISHDSAEPDRERLKSLQQKLASVLEMGWWGGIGQEARTQIEEALELVEHLRLVAAAADSSKDVDSQPHSRDSRGSPGNSRRSSALGLSNFAKRAHGSICSNGSHSLFSLIDHQTPEDEQRNSPSSDSLLWLVQTFTAADLDAAEGHEAGSELKVRNMPSGGSEDMEAVDSRKMLRTISSFVETEEGRDSHVDSTGFDANSSSRRPPQAQVSASSILKTPKVAEMFKKAGQLDFDALRFAESPHVQGRPLEVLGIHLMKGGLVQKLSSQGAVPEALSSKFKSRLIRFLAAVDGLYEADVPYHNSAHAADVMMTMEWFLRSQFMKEQVSTLDHLMVSVAAAIHDVGHPGRNNLFLTKTMAAIAVTYNDKSVLENMHVAKSFEVMTQSLSTNWFDLLPRSHKPSEAQDKAHDLQQYVRRAMIDMVLATDMAKHSDHVRKMEVYAEELCADRNRSYSSDHAEETPHLCSKQEALEKKLLLLECVLHAADISNPCKPHDIMLRWTERVLEEFWSQGDEERQLNIDVSPLCDRETGKQSVARGQIGFINFVIRPFYVPISMLIPEAEEAVRELNKNLEFWQQMDSEQVPYEALFAPDGCQEEDSPEAEIPEGQSD